MSFLHWFGVSQSQQPPAVVTAEATMAASKAVAQMEFLCRSYGMSVVDGSTIDDLKADLATMVANADLGSLRLELLGSDNRVLFEFKVAFTNASRAGRAIDSAKGVEVPLLDRRLVTGRRLIVERNGHESRYKHLLKINWGPAETFQKSAGSGYTSEHTTAITGGRQAATFHVGDAARHQLVVTQTGTRPFFFAKDLTLDRDGVFVLTKHLPSGVEPRVGLKLTALVIATPRGLQARPSGQREPFPRRGRP